MASYEPMGGEGEEQGEEWGVRERGRGAAASRPVTSGYTPLVLDKDLRLTAAAAGLAQTVPDKFYMRPHP